MTAGAPSQAHLQGAQYQRTKANLAKEPALFLRSRDTPYFGGHILSIQITKTKGEHTTWVLPKAGLDVVSFGSSSLLIFSSSVTERY